MRKLLLFCLVLLWVAPLTAEEKDKGAAELPGISKKTEGLSAFIVDVNQAEGNGLKIQPIESMINHHSCELFFDDLEIPADNLLGEEGKGFKVILDGMNAERILIAAECVGDGSRQLDGAVAHGGQVRCSEEDRRIG